MTEVPKLKTKNISQRHRVHREEDLFWLASPKKVNIDPRLSAKIRVP